MAVVYTEFQQMQQNAVGNICSAIQTITLFLKYRTFHFNVI